MYISQGRKEIKIGAINSETFSIHDLSFDVKKVTIIRFSFHDNMGNMNIEDWPPFTVSMNGVYEHVIADEYVITMSNKHNMQMVAIMSIEFTMVSMISSVSY